MEVKQNPFSLYDFLGYFVPGAIFIYLALIGHSNHYSNLEELQKFQKLENILPFTLLAYLLGHIINYLSALTIEKHAIQMYGYPSKTIIKETEPERTTSKHDIFYTMLTRIIIAPVAMIDLTIGRFLKIDRFIKRSEDKTIRTIIKFKIYELLKEKGSGTFDNFAPPHLTNFFILAYHYCVEKCPNHLPKMQNYVALYGFLRANCFALICATWMTMFNLDLEYLCNPRNIYIVIHTTILSAIAFILYLGFLKFYRRFCLEVLLAFCVTYEPRNSNSNSK